MTVKIAALFLIIRQNNYTNSTIPSGAPACAQTFWHLYHNTEVTGGALTSSGGTRAQCVTSCESLGTSCVGLTYVSTNCYVFLTSAPAVNVGNTAGAVHMRRCDAPVTAPAVSARKSPSM